MTRKHRLAAVAALVVGTTAAAAYAGGPLLLGPASQTQQPTYQGYYDGHKDSYLLTDVSSKSQAAALHINYAPVIKKAAAAPPQYFVKGPAAAGQITVFGSEPGKPDYNPLWDEIFVTWKAGVTPILLVKDDQIKKLIKSGKLTMQDPHIVLNAPILTVGK